MVGSSEGSGSNSSSEDRAPAVVESFGWVYHMGVNSIGREYCHLRFLYLKGKHVMMYKRDLHENPGIKPIRKGVVSNTLMVEELGRRKVNHGDVFVLRFSNRLDDTKKGEIACATAAEARKWVEAFDQARQQVNKVAENLAKEEEEMTQRSLISDSQCLLEKVTHKLFASQPQLAGSQAAYDLWRGSGRAKINTENEINLEGHRPRLRPYTADGLKKLVRIGKGPEKLLHQSSDLGSNARSVEHLEGDVIDANEAHEWKCILTVNGIRIFEDVASAKTGKGLLMKSIAVIDANLDIVFDVVCNLDKHQRYQWDMLTGDLDLIDSIDGHYDVIYGTYDPKYLTRWHSKRDFVFSRQWFRGQDGSYTILQFPVIHKKRPPRSGYQRTEINPSTWEIRGLNPSPTPSADKCLVTQTLEIQSSGWHRWRHNHYSKFEKTIPCACLCQVAGLREYFAANPTLKFDSPTTVVHSSISSVSGASCELEDPNSKDEFYDAIASDASLEDEDSDEDVELPKGGQMKLKNVSWAIASLALKQRSALVANTELDANTSPISVDLNQFHGSMRQGKDASDTNCWTSPGGQGFMIRGKTYLTDYSKVVGGDPLLKLLAVDWFTADTKIDKVALYPKCLVQSEAAKKLPFILVINLQVPAKPNYSLALYYGANRPINKGSLLKRFVDGTDMFRDARFKLIPSIIEGYWMVKRAVGSKACILGKAVTCSYLRQDNFLEIDVDIGSSSVAKSIIGLVLGYVTSIVVDLAILIEAKEEKELPEYILGTVRLNRLRTDCAVPF